MVSTISESFCSTLQLQIYPLNRILNVVGAAGQSVPYLGYVETSITISESSSLDVLLLVVQNTNYNLQVPLIIGTNVLPSLAKLLSESEILPDVWKNIITCIHLSEVIPIKNTKPVCVPAGEKVVISGLSHMSTSSSSSSSSVLSMRHMVVEHATQSSLPGSMIISPALVEVQINHRTSRIPIQVFNTSSRSVTIPAQSVLCQLVAVDDIIPIFENTSNSLVNVSSQQVVNEPHSDFSSKFDMDQISKNLNPEQKSEVLKLLQQWKSVFSLHDLDLGHTTMVKHQIKLNDETPFKQRVRRIPPSQYDAVRKHIREMLDLGVIRPSQSPFSSNIVLVTKRDGSLRFCIDLRKLNARTVKDSYALPRIDETLDSLSGAKWFSVLDLKSAYWQIELAEEDKAKTAFSVGSLGFYECNRMAFGLTNAPATFQRLIESCMSDIHLSQCLLYLDDIVVFSKTYDEHIARLESVFKRLQDAGLKLSPSKCQLFRHKIKYLGHIVSEEGVATDPAKIDAVRSWPNPTNIVELRKFLGFVGYYRKFMPNFASIARPLHNLLGGTGRKRRGKSKPKPQPTFHWDEKEQEAFSKLVDLCCKAPVLAYADFHRPFIIHTDASLDGLGAVLYQEYDGVERAVAYASRSLSTSERNYPAHKLEFLALKWAVVEKFHDYLYGNQFLVRTDNNPLTYILTTAKLDATGHRWVSELANYNFSIKYRPGKLNKDADALSRMPEITSKRFQCLSNEVVSACIQIAQNPVDGLVETMGFSQQVVDDIVSPIYCLPSLSSQKWQELQHADASISKVVLALEDAKQPITLVGEAQKLYRQRSKLHMKEGVLYRKREDANGQIVHQLVLPVRYQVEALKSVHDQMGHMGIDRTLNLLTERFYWTNMTKDVSDYVSRCERCLRRKPATNKTAPLVSITTSYPLELVSIDYLSLETSKGGYENILVIMDHFTRYAQAYPTKNQTARTTARVLFDNFVCHYGFPARFHSDQGRNFMSNTLKHLCDMAGVAKSNTTIYHPMGNGQVERYNRTLLQMLGTLNPIQKTDWKTYVPAIVHAYNCTRHESTGYSPFYLLFGRQPRIPVDLLLGSEGDSGGKSYESFVESLRKRLKFAYDLAKSNVDKAQTHQKDYFDRRARNNCLYPGCRVLVRNVGLKGRNKLADRWKQEVYVVVSQPDEEVPVYQVKLEVGRGKHKTLHRNLLLPIGEIPIIDPDERDDPDLVSDSEVVVPVPSSELGPVLLIADSPTDDSEIECSSLDGSDQCSLSDSPNQEEVSKPILRPRPIPRRTKNVQNIEPVPEPRPKPAPRKSRVTPSVVEFDSQEEDQASDSSFQPVPRPRRRTTPPRWMDPNVYKFQQRATFVTDLMNKIIPAVFSND